MAKAVADAAARSAFELSFDDMTLRPSSSSSPNALTGDALSDNGDAAAVIVLVGRRMTAIAIIVVVAFALPFALPFAFAFAFASAAASSAARRIAR